jgi:cell pole-organizing protein PopZ
LILQHFGLQKTSPEIKIRCYIVAMSRSSAKPAKGSQKTATRTVKKPAKAKSARAADKKAAKSARSPVGKAPTVAKVAVGKAAPISKMAETARALMGAARASKAAAAAKAAKGAIKPEAAQAQESTARIIRTVSPPVQPAAPEIVVKSHRYQVGELVYFTSPSFGRAAASGSYTVVKLLPSDTDDYQYRIKSSGEAFERVAKESQLEKM